MGGGIMENINWSITIRLTDVSSEQRDKFSKEFDFNKFSSYGNLLPVEYEVKGVKEG